MDRPAAPTARGQAPLDVDLVMAVALGGAAGSLLRWLLAETWPTPPGQFPWTTLAVNLLGSALLGVLAGIRPRWPRSDQLYAVLTVGVLGGFTTFSTYALHGTWLIQHSRWALAAVFLVGSALAGVALAAAGLAAGAALARRTGEPAPEPGTPDVGEPGPGAKEAQP